MAVSVTFMYAQNGDPHSEIVYYVDGNEESRFTLLGTAVTLAARDGVAPIPVADFKAWIDEAKAWMLECSHRFGCDFTPKYPVVFSERFLRQPDEEIQLRGEVDGEAFRVDRKDGTITLRPRAEMTVTPGGVAWFLGLHERLIGAW